MKGVGALLAVLLLAAPAAAQPPKSGGVINLMQREELAVGFAIHETATIATVWPAGQVTVLACKSTAKSSLVRPPGTAAGRGIGLIVCACPAARSAARVAPPP